MPYKSEWVEPDIYLEHNGVRVFYTYDNDDYDDPNFCYYTTNEDDNTEDHFDVRDLKSWFPDPNQPEFLKPGVKNPVLEKQWAEYHKRDARNEHFKNVIKAAIDAGEITSYINNRHD